MDPEISSLRLLIAIFCGVLSIFLFIVALSATLAFASRLATYIENGGCVVLEKPTLLPNHF